MDAVTLPPTKRAFLGCQSNGLLQTLKSNKLLIAILGCLFIGIVSAYDTYLVAIEEQILNMEKNPICVDLIRLAPDGLTYFFLGKMIGTLAVISVLIFLQRIKYSHAPLVTGAIVAFQAMLLVYLHLSDPLLEGLPNFALLFYR